MQSHKLLIKRRDKATLLCWDAPAIGRRGGWTSAFGAAGGYDEGCGENRTGSAEQVNSRVAEQAGDETRSGTGNAVGDVEKGDECSHRATSVGRQHPLQRLHTERREDQGASQSSDEGSAKRNAFVRGYPDQHLADRLDGEGPERHAIAADLVGQRPKHDAHEDVAGTEGSHNKPGMAPAARGEIERREGGEAGEANALQHQAQALAPDLTNDTVER